MAKLSCNYLAFLETATTFFDQKLFNLGLTRCNDYCLMFFIEIVFQL